MSEHELEVLMLQWREGIAGERAAQTAYEGAITSRSGLEKSLIETQRLTQPEAKRQADLTVQEAGQNWLDAQKKNRDATAALYGFLTANPQLHRLALRLKGEAWTNLAERFVSRS